MALDGGWLAFRTVAEGLSANAGLRMAQEAGLKIRRATWLHMVGAARAHYARRVSELDRPIARRPTPQDVTDVPSSRRTGYLQYVDLFVRNKTTGIVSVRHQAIQTSALRSRQAIIELAKSRYVRAIDKSKVAPALWGTDPDEVIVGALYQATWQFTPKV